MNMKEKKHVLPAWILGASTWFGYHCGSGFASGMQAKVYVLKYGPKGIIVPLVAWIAAGVFIFIVADYARIIKANSYRDVGMSIYYPNKIVGKIVIAFWDIMVFMACMVNSSACMAGAGVLLQDLFGAPYWLGCAIFLAVLIPLLCVGKQALQRLGALSSGLIFLVILICAVGVLRGYSNLPSVFGNSYEVAQESTIGGLIRIGIIYGCIHISFMHTAIVIGGGFSSRKETAKFTILGIVMNCGMMIFSAICLFCYYPDNMESNMPLLDVVKSVPGVLGGILMIAYNVVLILAFLTTAGAVIEGQLPRIQGHVMKIIKSEFWARAAIIIFILALASLLSTLGLEAIVDKAMGFLAKLREPTWFYPLLILGPIAIHREMKKQRTCNAKLDQ